ncbi:MAG: hypothetical protein JKX81_02860 [Arenicella sp.]|nr:hypothetical protein [Arenicella sp.]
MTRKTRSVFLILIVSLFGACSKPATYVVKASVTSERGYGVVLYDLPITENDKYYRNVEIHGDDIRINPMIPGEYDTYSVLPPFKNFEGAQLPNEIILKYQYAILSGCSSSWRSFPLDPASGRPIADSTTQFHTKRKCQHWRLLDDRIYTKTIDLRELNASDKMAALGTKNRSGNPIGVELIFEFFDDGDVRARLENTTHNRWK